MNNFERKSLIAFISAISLAKERGIFGANREVVWSLSRVINVSQGWIGRRSGRVCWEAGGAKSSSDGAKAERREKFFLLIALETKLWCYIFCYSLRRGYHDNSRANASIFLTCEISELIRLWGKSIITGTWHCHTNLPDILRFFEISRYKTCMCLGLTSNETPWMLFEFWTLNLRCVVLRSHRKFRLPWNWSLTNWLQKCKGWHASNCLTFKA